ncbi:hypothetical protein O6H91_03G092100 [Diphasiastrum complanatum]|uniref:Uncharacterized protein n=1 Tax=Diphasiastrum complanatum TaxID=34168 RepID=A0ACC2E8R3_DIPCM|nr:hypothetical protein O6H91_03G092100 [Diphasiastrum complanatum]
MMHGDGLHFNWNLFQVKCFIVPLTAKQRAIDDIMVCFLQTVGLNPGYHEYRLFKLQSSNIHTCAAVRRSWLTPVAVQHRGAQTLEHRPLVRTEEERPLLLLPEAGKICSDSLVLS